VVGDRRDMFVLPGYTFLLAVISQDCGEATTASAWSSSRPPMPARGRSKGEDGGSVRAGDDRNDRVDGASAASHDVVGVVMRSRFLTTEYTICTIRKTTRDENSTAAPNERRVTGLERLLWQGCAEKGWLSARCTRASARCSSQPRRLNYDGNKSQPSMSRETWHRLENVTTFSILRTRCYSIFLRLTC